MNTILLLLIFAGLVGLLLVVFYMLDRVNELHKQSGVTLTGHTPIKPDESFGGLNGKALWDAMAGIPIPGWTPEKLEPLKLRYEAILQKHVEMLFEDGQLDGREGYSMPVRCDRVIPTLRGEIESWIPHEYATVVYRCGHDRTTKPEEEFAAIRERIDQAGSALFAATGLPPHSLANLLMPIPPPPPPPPLEENPEGAEALALAAPTDEHAPLPESGDPALALTAEPVALETTSENKPVEAAPEAQTVPVAAVETPVK